MSQINAYLVGTGAAPIEKITGNTGGAVGPSLGGNINLTGTNPITVAGTPATNSLAISILPASTTQVGVVELATNAETIAGVDSTAAVVSSSLAAKLGSQTLNGVAYGGGSSAALNWTAVGNNGQVLIGATGGAPAFNSLTSTGGTIAFTPGANSLNLEVAAGGFTWNEITVVGPTSMVVENGYIANNAGLVSLLLPAVASQGATLQIAGKGAGGWKITQNAGQTIHFNSSDTTTGSTGSLASTNRYNVVELLCITANTDWLVLSSSGNLTVV
jgi:hypothetical protein